MLRGQGDALDQRQQRRRLRQQTPLQHFFERLVAVPANSRPWPAFVPDQIQQRGGLARQRTRRAT